MTKTELEEKIKLLERKNKALESFVIKIKKIIQTYLQPFRDNVADYDDERNKGILAVINYILDIYNEFSNFDKIEPLNKCEIINFKVLQGE